MSSPPAALDRADLAPAELVIRGARVVDPRAGLDGVADVLVRGGRIAEVGDGLSVAPGTEEVEARGLLVLPGFVDPHVHLRTPGREDEEDVESGTRAAAAGGFCRILAMANTYPVVDEASVLRSLRARARREARVPVGFLASITRGLRGEELTEMAELADEGAVGFSDDGVPVRRAGVLRHALQYQRLARRTLALHEEDPSLSGDGVMHEGRVSALLGLAGIPSISEATAIARDAAVARYEDGRIHVQHVSARESVEEVERAKALGARITAEVTPHHLTLTDEHVRTLDSHLKMNPPLRADSDRRALLEALRSGTIDCVATDHAPHSREEKEQPFEEAPMGIIGLETAWAVLHTELVRPGLLPLGVLVERLTAGGAPFGLPEPTLAPGAPADLCVVDPEATWEVGEAGYESRSANSPWAGRTLTGRVRLTLAAGAVAFRYGALAPVGGS
jgi:dihydroorotase